MARDARLSILTAQEVDELYRLPRFTEADRGLYFDLNTAEMKPVDDVVTLSVAVLGAPPRIATLHGVSGEQFRRFVDDTTRLVINAMNEEPAARLDTRLPSPGASRQKLIGTVWQLVVNGSTDCDIYERRARYRRGLTLWKSLLIPPLPEGRRSLARASRAWPSPLRQRLTAALSNSSLRE